MIEYKIQEITPQYLDETLELIIDVFMEFEGNDYSQKGIDEFKKYIEKGNIKLLLKDNLKIWIALLNNRVIGIIATRDINHISLLFVAKEYHQKGIATNLFKLIVNECIENNLDYISVNSSPYAQLIYNKLGFVETSKEQSVNEITFIPMIYNIK